jgi:hypothetical protein
VLRTAESSRRQALERVSFADLIAPPTNQGDGG